MDLGIKTNVNIPIKKQQPKDKTSFGNLSAILANPALSTYIRMADTDPFIGANSVDLFSMVLPRSVIAMARDPKIGVETMRRESSSMLVHTTTGLMGLGVGALMSGVINNKYGINASSIKASNDTIDLLEKAWKKASGDVADEAVEINSSPEKVNKYVINVLQDITGLANGEWKPLSEKSEVLETAAKKITDLITEKSDSKWNFKAFRKNTEEKEKIIHEIVHKLGAKSSIKVNDVETDLKLLINDITNVGKAFTKVDAKKGVKLTDFVEHLKKLKIKQTALGMLVASAVAVSVQPLNRYITKKKTGQDSFGAGSVKDESAKFKTLKAIAAAGMVTIAAATLGAFNKGKGAKDFFLELPKKLQFKGIWATIPQLKVVYASAITGRILASRDKNELRETVTRDYLGFTNWMVFGGVVGKLMAYAQDKNNINIEKGVLKEANTFGEKLKNLWSVATKGVIKSPDEITDPLLNNEQVFKNGKRSFKKMFEYLDEKAIKQIKQINISTLSGIAYSGLMLGVLIPILNKKITEAKKANQINQQSQIQPNQQNSSISYTSNKIHSEDTDKKYQQVFNEFLKNN